MTTLIALYYPQMTKEEFMTPRERLYPTTAEIEAEKAFAKRINFEVGWITYNPRIRNPKPTEEEKRMFIEQYGAKRKSR